MKIFFDTEFTDLYSFPKLISIGCVAEDGRECYFELTDTYQVSDCSDFVMQVVHPLLQGGDCKVLEAQLSVKLRDWIEGLSEDEVVLCSDSPHYDYSFVQEIFHFYGTFPKNMNRKCGGICYDNHAQAFRQAQALEDFWKTHGARRHHALVDARSLQYAHKYATKGGSDE